MRFGIIGNLDKPGLGEAAGHFIKKLEQSGMSYVVDAKIAELLRRNGVQLAQDRCAGLAECVSRSEMVVAFGGDGTILSAARTVGPRGTPILGINLGKLGFLAELAPEEMDKAVDDILQNKYMVQERLLLQASTVQMRGRTFHAVNDVVVDKARSSRVIDLETYIDDVFAVTYRGDGLIISTPTGSTAYALSNGGPIVIPTSNVIGITPISPHTLSGRPLIIPDTSIIRVTARSDADEILLSADGQEEALLKAPLEVEIRKADYTLKLVKRLDKSYFDVLRAKLLWGKDVRSA
jgi:NAD+ kinase